MYQRVVDHLSLFLQGDDQTLTPEFEKAAKEYSEACERANERLRRCNDLLGRGLRSEAINFAEAEPKLLDLVQTLDFPERKRFEEVAAIYTLPKPPGLLLETAYALNQAYAEQAPFEELLVRFRRHSLARASVGQRLQLLRRIAAVDSGNPVWDEDVRTFEKARFRELVAECRPAAAGGETRVVVDGLRELQSGEYREAVPSKLLGELQNLAAEAAGREIMTTARALEDAYSSLDLSSGRKLRERWNDLMALAGDDSVDRARYYARAALEWIAGEDTRAAKERDLQTAIDDLVRALGDSNSSIDRLQRAGRTVLQHAPQIPSPYDAQLQDRIAALQRQKTTKAIAIGVGIAVAASVIAFIGYRVVAAGKLAADVRQAAESLKDFEEKKLFRSGLEAAEKLAPDVRGAAAVAERVKSLQKQSEDEDKRLADFKEAIRKIEEAPKEAPLPAELEQAAQSLAKSSEERNSVTAAARKHQEALEARKSEMLARVQKDIGAAEDDVRQYETAAKSGPVDAFPKDRVDKTRGVLKAILDKRSDLEGSDASRVEAMMRRVAEAERRIEWRREEPKLVRKLSECKPMDAGWDGYVNLFRKYAEGSPDKTVVEERKQTCEEEKVWRSILAFKPLIERLGNDHGKLSPSVAGLQRGSVRDFLDEWPMFPDAPLLKERERFLDAVKEQPKLRGKVREIFDDFLIKNLFSVKMKDRKIYYAQQQVKFSETEGLQNRTVKILMDDKGLTKNKMFVNTDVQDSTLSPQSKFAKENEPLASEVEGENWEAKYLQAISQLQAGADMDAVLRAKLLKMLAEIGGKGSVPLAQALERSRVKQIEDQDVAWMNPEKDADAAREKATEQVARVASAKDIGNAIDEVRRRHNAQLVHYHRPVGWLHRNDRDEWSLRPFADANLAALVDAPLLAAKPSSGGSGYEWTTVGKANGGAVSLGTNEAGMREGRPVFVREDLLGVK